LAPVAATAAGAGAVPRLLAADFGTFAVRPAQIIASGDGSLIIGGTAAWIGRNPHPREPGTQFGQIGWSAWTTGHATGVGVEWTDNCKPDCAQGTYYPLPVTVVATRALNGVYTRLLLSSRIPVHGRERVTQLTLEHLNAGATGYIWR
jgi:hypothetical protein